jgi:3-phenylpropionate/trans-cinnamate dioxygenase ferredoxin reductase subunit
VAGRVIGQERLTHDITRLRIQLDEGLQYKAGQFAQLSLAPLGSVERSYSFATPVQPDAQVQFFIRKVAGGALSTLVNERSVIGENVAVDGPLGDFWLRPADAPLLFIAGGSGLAPVLAVMRDALDAGVRRPATLLFGAREQRDLYALDEISAIGKTGARRSSMCRCCPPPPRRRWQGRRGMVGDHRAARHARRPRLPVRPARHDRCLQRHAGAVRHRTNTHTQTDSQQYGETNKPCCIT